MRAEVSNYDTSESLRLRKQANNDLFRNKIEYNKEILNSMLSIKDKKNKWKGLKILDVGCGYGVFSQVLREQDDSWEIWGSDVSKGMIAEAKKTTDKSIKYSVADAQKLPFKNELFDVVIAKHMLYHVDDVKKGVKEMHRVLKNGGTLIITLNSLDNGSRANIEKYLKGLGKILNAKRIETVTRVNMENCLEYVSKKDFRLLEVRRFFSYAEIESSSSLTRLMSSYRDFFEPKPSPEKWETALGKLDALIAADLKKKGKIEEIRGTGIIKLQKI